MLRNVLLLSFLGLHFATAQAQRASAVRTDAIWLRPSSRSVSLQSDLAVLLVRIDSLVRDENASSKTSVVDFKKGFLHYWRRAFPSGQGVHVRQVQAVVRADLLTVQIPVRSICLEEWHYADTTTCALAFNELQTLPEVNRIVSKAPVSWIFVRHGSMLLFVQAIDIDLKSNVLQALKSAYLSLLQPAETAVFESQH